MYYNHVTENILPLMGHPSQRSNFCSMVEVGKINHIVKTPCKLLRTFELKSSPKKMSNSLILQCWFFLVLHFFHPRLGECFVKWVLGNG